MPKYTPDDIKLIANAMRRQRDHGPDHLFTMLTGAGCSRSAGVPTAKDLIKIINEEYKRECRHRLNEDQRKNYGDCMAALTRNERKRILDPLLKNAKVNWGHLAIAAMMEAGYVGRVLTFNFDSILARACGLLGIYPATYDFVSGATSRTDYIEARAILHLHGQGHSLAMLNTREETEKHAENLAPLLKATLNRSPLLVIGYSGDADAVFPVIEREYTANERLYWAGYDETPARHIETLIKKGDKTAQYLGGSNSDRFLIELATELECWPPKLFTNPYEHLLEELSPVADFPFTESGSQDLLKDLRAELEQKQKQKDDSKEDLSTLAMKGEWQAIIETVGDATKNDKERDLLSWAYINLGNEALVLAEEKSDKDIFEQSFEKYAKAIEIKPDKHEAYNNWGTALWGLAEREKDKDLFEQSFEKYAKTIEIKPDKHEAYNNWGNALLELARQEKDKDLFEQSFEKYAKAIEINPVDHEAYNNWGNALLELAKQENDKALFEQSFEKYAKAIEINPDEHDAYDNWGNALLDLARQEKDKDLFEQSFEKYAKAIEIKPDKHDVYYNWGNALLDLARQEKDKDLFEQSFEKFAKAIEINPDDHETYDNWGSSLLYLYALDPQKTYLEEALKILETAKNINSNITYNLACVYARLGKFDECRKELQNCQMNGTLLSKEHLETDTDLDSVRKRDWFQALLDDL